MGRERTVVIVDDDEQIREILRRLVPSVGAQVCAELSSGEEAVAWITENEADIVIMDLQMPGIGGVEATRLIKGSDPDVTIFGFTGWGTADAEAMLAVGASAVFEKTKLRDLLNVLADLQV